jgi:hypothetical protein
MSVSSMASQYKMDGYVGCDVMLCFTAPCLAMQIDPLLLLLLEIQICIAMKFYEGSVGEKMARLKGERLPLLDVLRYSKNSLNICIYTYIVLCTALASAKTFRFLSVVSTKVWVSYHSYEFILKTIC